LFWNTVLDIERSYVVWKGLQRHVQVTGENAVTETYFFKK